MKTGLIFVLILFFAFEKLSPTEFISNSNLYVVKILPGQKPRSSQPDCMAEIGEHVYFQADDGVHGRELWRTDGTLQRTQMIKDLLPWKDSEPCHFHELNGNVVFSAEGPGDTGRELWITDGTAAGTHFIKDLFPGRADNDPEALGITNGKLLLSAGSLWTTDGTTQGTKNLGAIYPIPEKSITLNGIVYFSASAEEKGFELYRSDGTELGTRMVREIYPGKGSSYPRDFAVLNNFLYFIATDPTHGSQLWKTNGTHDGTTKITNIQSGKTKSIQCCLNRSLLFSVEKTNVIELWKIEELTAAKKFFILESKYGFDFLGFHKNEIYFRAWRKGIGVELWKTNGTAEGTELVKDLIPGPDDSYPSNFVSTDEYAFFLTTGPSTQTIWKTDGTPDGTIELGDNAVGGYYSENFQRLSNMILYEGEDQSNGNELWKVDANGIAMVRDIAVGMKSADPNSLTAAGSKLYFLTNPNSKLWVSDGSEEGTRFIQQLNTTGKRPDSIIEMIGTKQYLIGTLLTPREDHFALWRSDGTQSGTIVLLEGTGEFRVDSLRRLNDIILFAASDREHGKELWRTDGTKAGTYLLKDLLPGPQGSNVRYLTNWKGIIYFEATDKNRESFLWKTEGTQQSTKRIAKLPSGGSLEIIPAKNYLFFVPKYCSPCDVWISDGTTIGTRKISALWPLRFIGFPSSLANNLVIPANKDGIGDELWITNPVMGSVQLVRDINPGEDGSFPSNLFTWNGVTYFSAYSPDLGRELWRTDGTSSGTFLLKDIVQGQRSSDPSSFYPYHGRLYFNARNHLGTELWSTDGTRNGTQLYSDINPGIASSLPRNFIQVGSKLFFTVTNLKNGSELVFLEN